MSGGGVWMRDRAGTYAYVPGGEVDTWTVRGLEVADEPQRPTDMVFMHHDELDGTPVIAWGARDYWTGRGFEPSAPPEPVDPTRDPALDDEQPAARPAKRTGKAASAAEVKE